MRETRRFKLTRTPVRATSQGRQALWLAVDVLPFDSVSWRIRALNVERGGSVRVAVLTGMQCETDDEWVTVGQFDVLTASGVESTVEVPNVLRYIRYEVTELEGDAATFEIVGEGCVKGQPSLTSEFPSFRIRDLMVFGLPWWQKLHAGQEPDCVVCTHCSPCTPCSGCTSCTNTCQGCSRPADLYDDGVVMDAADVSFLRIQQQLDQLIGE